jgi:addiction module RelE/StbE family toxin
MKVVWSDPAVDDLEAIWDHVAEDSPGAARRLVAKLLEAVDHLETFPRMGRTVPEDESASSRELIVGSYRVLYQVVSEKVEILAVVHGNQDLTAGIPPWDRPE